jgi:hypothetical protein
MRLLGLALNITIAQPAKFTLNGKTGRESEKALALLQSLDAQQRSKSVLNYPGPISYLVPGRMARRFAPEGLKVSSMNAKQQALLLDVRNSIHESCPSSRSLVVGPNKHLAIP